MYAGSIALTFHLIIHNENSHGMMHVFESKMCARRISYLQHHKVCLEQVEAPLGMGIKVHAAMW